MEILRHVLVSCLNIDLTNDNPDLVAQLSCSGSCLDGAARWRVAQWVRIWTTENYKQQVQECGFHVVASRQWAYLSFNYGIMTTVMDSACVVCLLIRKQGSYLNRIKNKNRSGFTILKLRKNTKHLSSVKICWGWLRKYLNCLNIWRVFYI